MMKRKSAIPADTSRDAAKVQFAVLRRMTIEQRAKMAFELSDNVRETLKAGIRQRHPEYDECEVVKEVLRLTLDKELFAKVCAAWKKRK